MNRLLLLFFLLINVQFLLAQEKNVTFSYREQLLKGTYLKAKKSNGLAVLIIPGSGPTDRDGNNLQMKSNAYKYLALHLAERGISSLRYDKVGVGESATKEMKEEDVVFTDNVEMADAAYAFLEKQEGIKKVSIIGHSEGSLIGILLAQKVNCHRYISLAGTAYPINEILKTQFTSSIPEGPLQTMAIAYLDTLKAGGTLTDVNPMLASFFRPSIIGYLKSWFVYDPRVEIAKLNIPVLIIQGDRDIQVSNDNADELALAKKDAEKVLVPDVNHILKVAPLERAGNIATYNSPDVDIAEGIKNTISDFILK